GQRAHHFLQHSCSPPFPGERGNRTRSSGLRGPRGSCMKLQEPTYSHAETNCQFCGSGEGQSAFELMLKNLRSRLREHWTGRDARPTQRRRLTSHVRVGLGTHLEGIEPRPFDFGVHSVADGASHDDEEGEGEPENHYEVSRYSDELRRKLSRVAI